MALRTDGAAAVDGRGACRKVAVHSHGMALRTDGTAAVGGRAPWLDYSASPVSTGAPTRFPHSVQEPS